MQVFFIKKQKNGISTEKMRFFADDFRLLNGFDVLRMEAFQIFNISVFAFSFQLREAEDSGRRCSNSAASPAASDRACLCDNGN